MVIPRIFSSMQAASAAALEMATPVRALLALPGTWRRRLRNRHELAQLDLAQMRDTGLNPDMVQRESQKPFWQA